MRDGDWDFSPPTPSTLGDHAVPLRGDHLAGRRVALMVCGGIAAFKAPMIARDLRRHGAAVTAFASTEALRYVTEDALAWSTDAPVVTRLSPRAEHLSDAAPFDAYLVAPASYNTINKFAAGIADGVLTTTLASALGRLERGQSAVLVAPTMHGSMHNRILVDSLRRLADLGVRVIPPRDAYGKHNLPEEERLLAEVCRATSRSPLRGRRVLVIAGRIAERHPHGLLVAPAGSEQGVRVALDLHLRGAEVCCLAGMLCGPVPEHLSIDAALDLEALVDALERHAADAVVWAAALAGDAGGALMRLRRASGSAPWLAVDRNAPVEAVSSQVVAALG